MQTRERVLQIVQKYGYEPDPTARSLSFQRTRKVSQVFQTTQDGKELDL